MKYKKRSLKKKQRRHHFSKKYANVQRGGGFMDAIADLNAMEGMEGRINTCMAVHPTQQLVAVGDDAGTVTLWEINQPQPKRVAQLMGLQTTVKCVEFHPTIPVVAAACSDIVLMWRIDQIDREQQDQQVQPSHMVSDFRVRNETEVEQELRAAEQNFEEADRTLKAMYREQVTIDNNLRDIDRKRRDINDDQGRNGYPGFTRGADHLESMLKFYTSRNREMELETLTKLQPLRQKLTVLKEEEFSLQSRYNESKTRSDSISINTYDIELKIKALDRELKLIRIKARDEVSCIAFYPGNTFGKYSYIAVGVNNIDNRIIMYRFNIEPSSLVEEYRISRNSLHPGPLDHVLMVSFSHDGKLFSFVTKSSDGITVLKVRNFKGPETRYYETEYESYRIDSEKKRAITSIRPCSSNIGVFSWGTEYKHNFLIGCDDGYLTMIEAKTQTSKNYGAETRIQDLKSIREWNAGEEPIKCVAVHPSLPLFANGSRTTANLWDISIDEREPLKSLDLDLQDVISVGFNQNFLAVCGPGSMRFYSCNSDDYGVVKEELHKKLKIGSEIANYGTELALANRQGEPCSICKEPMNNPLTQPALRSGPEDAVEEYLGCGHKFHNKCIGPWIKKGNPCPLCRAPDGLVQATPPRIITGRQIQAIEQAEQGARSVSQTLQDRSRRFLDFGQGTAAAAIATSQVAVPVSQVAIPVPDLEPEPSGPEPELTPEELRAARLKYFKPGSQSQGGRRNKLKKTKKSKIRNYYSKKNKKK